jgi:hypothetical protein
MGLPKCQEVKSRLGSFEDADDQRLFPGIIGFLRTGEELPQRSGNHE